MNLPNIRLPDHIRKGEPITADWANSIRNCLARLASGADTPSNEPAMSDAPFSVAFSIALDGSYTATVNRGVVVEIHTKGGTGTDGVIIHQLTDLDLDSDGKKQKFAITDGQCVYVKYEVADTGQIKTTSGGKPQIVIAASGAESQHYDPPVGNETAGTDGVVYRKLAQLDVDGSVPRAIIFEAGGNLIHYRELPMFVKAGGTADVFKEFDLSAGKYKTRGLKGSGGITVTQNTDDIDIKCAGWWGDVVIDYTPAVGSTDSLTMRFEDGILKRVFKTAGEVSGTEATPGNANLTIVDTDT